jgi:hypothetical protein
MVQYPTVSEGFDDFVHCQGLFVTHTRCMCGMGICGGCYHFYIDPPPGHTTLHNRDRPFFFNPDPTRNVPPTVKFVHTTRPQWAYGRIKSRPAGLVDIKGDRSLPYPTVLRLFPPPPLLLLYSPCAGSHHLIFQSFFFLTIHAPSLTSSPNLNH